LVLEIFAESNEPIFAGTEVLKNEVAVRIGVSQREIRRTDGRRWSSAATDANRLVLVNLQVQSSLLSAPHVNEVVMAFNSHYSYAFSRGFAAVFEHSPFD
jgi:hypothetical protein